MNGLVELIDSRIKKCDSGLKTVPCTVLALEDNEYVKVATLTDQSVFTVLNESGSSLEVGELVQLAYTGLLSNSSGYIIASKNKSNGAAYTNVSARVYTGSLFTSFRPIASVGVKTGGATDCVLYINCNLSAESDGVVEFEVEINNVVKTFKPKYSVAADEYSFVSFAMPITLSGDENEVWVSAKGEGIVNGADVFVGGHGLEGYDLYDITGDNDYIFTTSNSQSNVIYYIGSSNRPRMPITLNNAAIDTLYATAFNYSGVQAVYIPEGITEID